MSIRHDHNSPTERNHMAKSFWKGGEVNRFHMDTWKVMQSSFSYCKGGGNH